MLLVDTDTEWWKHEKEYRELEKTLRRSKDQEIQREMKTIRLRDMYNKMLKEEKSKSSSTGS